MSMEMAGHPTKKAKLSSSSSQPVMEWFGDFFGMVSYPTPEKIMLQRHEEFKKNVSQVLGLNPSFRKYLIDDTTSAGVANAKQRKLTPTQEDLESDKAVFDLYLCWRLHHNIWRTPEEMQLRFDTFKKNALFVFEMNKMYPDSCFHLCSFCDEKDLLDYPSVEQSELPPPKPREEDFESDEAVWDLYHRWCLHYEIRRTPKEMQERLYTFWKNAIHTFEMNQNDPSCQDHRLSLWSDKIKPFYRHGDEEEKTVGITPTKEDMETDETMWALYTRWCLCNNISRTPKSMQYMFINFKKSASHAFEMNQKDPSCQFCLSVGCDETDERVDEMTIIPTEMDLKSGNAMLQLFLRYRFYYRRNLGIKPEVIKHKFNNFKNSVLYVFELNQKGSRQYCLDCPCHINDSLEGVATEVKIIPTCQDLESDEALLELYDRCCVFHNTVRSFKEKQAGLDSVRKNAKMVFELNLKHRGGYVMSQFFDECEGESMLDLCALDDEDEELWC